MCLIPALAFTNSGIGEAAIAFPFLIAGLCFGASATYATRRRWALARTLPPRQQAVWMGALATLLAPFAATAAVATAVLVALVLTRP